MASILGIVVAVILFAIWAYKSLTYRPKNFPPGPLIKIPLIGSYLLLLLSNWKYPHVALHKWRKKYGDIVGLYVADVPTVVVLSHKRVKEFLLKKEFDGRPISYAAQQRAFGKDLGMVFVEGDFWHQQRRYSLRYMRDFGFGRRFAKLEDLVQYDVQIMIDLLRDGPKEFGEENVCKNGRVLLPDLFYPTMLNGIMSILGKEPAPRSEYSYYRKVGKGSVELQRGFHQLGGMLSFLPWLRFVMPDIVGYTDIMKSNKVLHEFMQNVINNNKSTLLEDENRNFIDMYLKEMKDDIEINGDRSYYSEQQLTILALDYVFPAMTTVTSTLTYFVQYLLHYPNVQQKIQEEIDQVVGRGRLPILDDRPNMPYLEAVLREVMRIETLVPLGVPHKVLEDTTFMGYDIPKDTLILGSLYSAHMDEEVWGDPENFRPERFLDEKGQLLKKDLTVAFGAGKRLCAGETFGRHTMFQITSGLLQNFTFRCPKGEPLPDISNEKVPGMVNTIRDNYWVQAVYRN